jgi:hypothetical protein
MTIEKTIEKKIKYTGKEKVLLDLKKYGIDKKIEIQINKIKE